MYDLRVQEHIITVNLSYSTNASMGFYYFSFAENTTAWFLILLNCL